MWTFSLGLTKQNGNSFLKNKKNSFGRVAA